MAILLALLTGVPQATAATSALKIERAQIAQGALTVEGRTTLRRARLSVRLHTYESRVVRGKTRSAWTRKSTARVTGRTFRLTAAAGGTAARYRVQLFAAGRLIATSKAATVSSPAPSVSQTETAAPTPTPTPTRAPSMPGTLPPGTLRPASDLPSGAALSVDQKLVSANGDYTLIMQADGNLVIYKRGGTAVWSSKTGGAGASVAMQSDGNLVVKTAARPLWNAGTDGFGGAFLRLQDDGNLVIYQAARAVWSSAGGYIGHTLGAGQQLTEGQIVRSPSGRYRLVMQGDGNFVLYRDGATPVWEIGAGGTGSGGKAIMQGDGNLVVGVPRGVTWASGTDGFPGGFLAVQDDGNAVIYQNGHAVWTWGSGYLGDTLLEGGELIPGAYLKSENKRIMLIAQPADGNLVVYRDSAAPLWAANTAGHPGARAVMQGDGNFVVYHGSQALWNSATSKPGSRVVMQDDENLVVYAPAGAVWSRFSGPIGGGGGGGAPGGSTGGYPHSGAADCSATFGIYSWCVGGTWASPRGYAYRNCTDWAAWRLQQMGASDGATRGLGHGGQWGYRAGGRTSGTPKVGRAAVKPSTGSNDFGHVAVVEAVHSNGQITISEYNRYMNGTYSTWTGSPGSRGFTQFVDMGL